MSTSLIIFCISGAYLCVHLIMHAVRMRTASARERELHPSLERLEEVIAHWLLIGKKRRVLRSVPEAPFMRCTGQLQSSNT